MLKRYRPAGMVAQWMLFLAATASAASPTFYQNVLPILQHRCQPCHRPGEIGPMPLLDYPASKSWATAIRQAVNTRQMPPWFADPACRAFL